MEKPGTILLGNPANLVVSKVTQIAVLEKKYKVIDWIDDMKSNQLGQLYAIWNVSKSLAMNHRNMTLSDTIVNDIISNIVPKAVDMHTRIVDEHSAYHEKANELRNQIATLVNEIKAIADTASGIDNVVSNGVVGVKRDQSKINAMRSKLLKIVQDNADRIDVSNATFDETSDDKLSVQFTVTLNKMDYNDIDQLANVDRTTDPKEEHMHIDNDDHATDVTSTLYKFDENGVIPSYTVKLNGLEITDYDLYNVYRMGQKYVQIKVTRNGIDITDKIHIEHPDGENITIATFDGKPAIRISEPYTPGARFAIVDNLGILKLVVAINDPSLPNVIPTVPPENGNENLPVPDNERYSYTVKLNDLEITGDDLYNVYGIYQKYVQIKVTRNGIDITDKIHIEQPDGENIDMAKDFGTIATFGGKPAIRISNDYTPRMRAAIVDDLGILKLVVAIADPSLPNAIPTVPDNESL